jgi:CRP-like cAMP-binding protein
MPNQAQLHEIIGQFESNNDKDSCVRLLFDLAVNFAKEKQFQLAEEAREKIYEIDPMALTEIIQSGEIIEEEKSKSIDNDHHTVWDRLYSSLSKEEANTLYYAMQEKTYGPDERIYEQGELNKNLFFIDKGELKQVFAQQGREFLVNPLRACQIAGAESFFDSSVSTTSLVTLTHVKLHLLNKQTLAKWEKESPGLITKLREFCSKYESVHDALEKKHLDRRVHKRVNVSGKALIQLQSVSGTPLGKALKVKLIDVSAGGVSFSIWISKKETARMLLGRKLLAKFLLPASGSSEQIITLGTVVAVNLLPLEGYTVHVRFDKPLDSELFENIG